MYRPKMGIGNVGSYLISAIPYVTSSLAIPASGSTPMRIHFPQISSFVVVKNDVPGNSGSAPLRWGFSQNGVNGLEENNYIILHNGESLSLDVRVSEIYLMADTATVSAASVAAGLTGINVDELLNDNQSWNNWSGSVGVG